MAGKIEAQTSRDTVDGTEYLATSASGADRKTLISKIKDYILTFFSNKTTLDKIEYYEGTFENSDLTTGYVTFTLTATRSTAFVYVEKPDGEVYSGYTVTRPLQTTIKVDFGGAIDSGTWKIKILALT